MRIVSGEFLRALLDFSKCRHNLIDVFFIAEQRGLWNPNRFPGCPLSVRKRLFQECVLLLGLRSTQALAIFAIAKHVQVVQWWIACLVRNSFCVHCLDKAFGRDAGKLLLVYVEDVGVLSISCAARIELLRRKPWNFAQFAVENPRILVPTLSLLIQSPQLGSKYRTLPLAEAIIR